MSTMYLCYMNYGMEAVLAIVWIYQSLNFYNYHSPEKFIRPYLGLSVTVRERDFVPAVF